MKEREGNQVMHAYIINMDSASKRWRFVKNQYYKTEIPFTRISAVVGKDLVLPTPEYDAAKYAACHGQRTNVGQVGCYFSHLKAMRAFLDSHHSHAIIAEDDSIPSPNLASILEAAIRYESCFDVLRICGFHNSHPLPFADLFGPYQLAVGFTRLCGTGAYLVSRHAAEVLLEKLVPMFLPIDHAMDREWKYGLRAASIVPLPVSQNDHPFKTQMPTRGNYKLPWMRRYWTVFPFRCRNEIERFVHRTFQWQEAKKEAERVGSPNHSPRQTPSNAQRQPLARPQFSKRPLAGSSLHRLRLQTR